MAFNFMSFSGSGSSIFGFPVYGRKSDHWLFRATLLPVWKLGQKLHRARLWFLYRFSKTHQYHLINTHLKPGYYDIDTLMLNGMFSLLRRYVEDEHRGADDLEKWGKELLGSGDFMAEHNHRQGNKEMEAVALYRWWMEALPEMRARERKLISLIYGKSKLKFEPVNGSDIFKLIIDQPDVESADLRKELDELTARIEREEQEMLHRLVDIRGSLWT